MAPAGSDARPAGPGARLRALRRRRGLTLVQLASRAGLSHPFLSQLERDRTRASLASLTRLAAALDVPLVALTDIRGARPTSFVRNPDGPPAGPDAPPDEPVLRPLSDTRGVLSLTETRTSGFEWGRWMRQPGERCVYVVSGRLDVDLDGALYELGPGDTLSFDGGLRRRYRRHPGSRRVALSVEAVAAAHGAEQN